MALIAYALREDYAGTVTQNHADGSTTEAPRYTGGLITIGNDELDVRAALDENDGTIVVTDNAVAAVAALDSYPALKRVAVPRGATPIVTPYDHRPIGDLRHDLSRRAIAGGARVSRERAIAALIAHDDALASGVTPDAPWTVAALTKTPDPDEGDDAKARAAAAEAEAAKAAADAAAAKTTKED